MYESSVVQHFAERALKQGIEQGIEQTLRENVQEALAIRFELAASDPLAARIGAIDDVPQLKQLHRAAIEAAQPRRLSAPVGCCRVGADGMGPPLR